MAGTLLYQQLPGWGWTGKPFICPKWKINFPSQALATVLRPQRSLASGLLSQAQSLVQTSENRTFLAQQKWGGPSLETGSLFPQFISSITLITAEAKYSSTPPFG